MFSSQVKIIDYKFITVNFDKIYFGINNIIIIIYIFLEVKSPNHNGHQNVPVHGIYYIIYTYI